MSKNRIAVIPARSGSKSIPGKNLIKLGKKPLIHYVIHAILSSGVFSKIIINSESNDFLEIANEFNVDFYRRDESLAQDSTDINDVLLDLLDNDVINSEWLYLFQPTSPFVSLRTINQMISLEDENNFDLLQSIAKVSHNSHAWNQRVIEGKRVKFVFPEERQIAFSKQQKPNFYTFGNLLAIRTNSYRNYRRIWMPSSGFVEVNRFEAFDLDGPEDISYGRYLLDHGIVELLGEGET